MDIDKPIITISLEKPTEDDVNRIYEIFTSEGTERFLTDSFKLLQSKTGVSMLLSNSLNKSNNIRCVARDVGFLRLINAKIERPSTLTGKDYAVEDTVGICHIAYNKHYSNTVNIFYVIDAKYRARGIGTWALREITRYIKEELFVIDSIDNIEFKGCVQDQMTVSRIEIVIADGNIASMRIAEKNGFEPEGIARKAAKVNGEFTDCTIYSLIPDEPIKLQFRSESTDKKTQLQIPKVEEPQPTQSQTINQEPQPTQQPQPTPTQQPTQPTQQPQPIHQEPQHTQPQQSKPIQTKIEGLNSRLDKALQVLDSMEQQTERSIQQANQHTKILNNFNEIVKQAVKYSEKAEKSVILDKLNDMVKEDTSENDENETMSETLGDLLSNMMNEVKEETQKNQSSDIEQISIKSTISESPCKVVNTVVDIEEQPPQSKQQSQPQPQQSQPQPKPQPTQQPRQSQPQPKPQVKITLKGLTNNSIKGKRD